MRLLLTSSGRGNPSIDAGLARLLGKPVAESRALLVPTALNPFPGAPDRVARLVRGGPGPSLASGWASLGVLELTVLPTVDPEVWVPTVQAADALVVWGGDPVYLSRWLRRSGLADLFATLPTETVYVGVSAGALAACSVFGETYLEAPEAGDPVLSTDEVALGAPGSEVERTFVTARGAGLFDAAVVPHLEHEDHPDASLAAAEQWAARLPVPVYAIDDQSAVTVVDGAVEVVSEGSWRLFGADG